MADLLFSPTPVTTRISEFLGARVLAELNSVWFETVAFFLMIGLGLGLCFVFKPKSRPQAFIRGSSVIGVLVTMNIGSQALATASAGELLLQDSANVTQQQPRIYGPFGLGTVLTGRSSAQTEAIEIDSSITVNCMEQITVGAETFCAISADDAVNALGLTLESGAENVWILQAN